MDVAVVEVGLGGRFDATNVVTPAVTAITTHRLRSRASSRQHAGGHRRRKGRHRQAAASRWWSATLPAEACAVVARRRQAAGARLVARPDTVVLTSANDAGHARADADARRCARYRRCGSAWPARHQRANAARRGASCSRCWPRRRRSSSVRDAIVSRPARRALAGPARVAAIGPAAAPACCSTRRTTRPAPARWRPTSRRPACPPSRSSPRSCATRT